VYKVIVEAGWIKDLSLMRLKIIRSKLSGVTEVDMDIDRSEGLGLTPREKEIFDLMLTDLPVKQIMIELEISKGTFNFHTSNLYRKLEIQSRTELLVKYGA
jgi:DNA-binding CsgD family transcriptional regulator